jgi:hypothetical protein
MKALYIIDGGFLYIATFNTKNAEKKKVVGLN